jgi:mono/diheme cytochrome c family protein
MTRGCASHDGPSLAANVSFDAVQSISPPVARVRLGNRDLLDFTRGLKPTLLLIFPALFLALLAGCDRLDMYDQPRYEPLEASDFFSDGLSARQPVEGTIPRGGLRDDERFYTGKDEGKLVSKIPEAAFRATHDRDPRHFERPYDETSQAELRRALLKRGQERFDIYCSVCHGRLGDGDGMVVRRGFRKPPSYHIDRLLQAPAGHFYDVMTNGFGAMASYANRIDVDDRWAIVAYIRALQLSQNARLDDVPGDQRDALSPSPGESGNAPLMPQEDPP